MVRSLPVRSLHPKVRSPHLKVRSLHQISYFAPNTSYFAPCGKLQCYLLLIFKVYRRCVLWARFSLFCVLTVIYSLNTKSHCTMNTTVLVITVFEESHISMCIVKTCDFFWTITANYCHAQKVWMVLFKHSSRQQKYHQMTNNGYDCFQRTDTFKRF